ncbi:peptide chain release factor N(5)-glutamine methyltransferase [uncultured Paraglaciecola sp.]|uniref:peptide chain release factor N(5)-glutamine methyltransferase n=1 Tax=uncultured Paraglaciecola sp. TaxID=1765024 RepID=UPI002616E01C|nr:peptide chain release factor N(5)-glutamine methyltransferase [uncultured Paraglaciecola sp.]
MDRPELTIAQALAWAKEQLSAQGVSDDGLFDSAAIDSKILLAACLQQEQVYLHTWPEKHLDEQQMCAFENYICQRSAGHPVAHIIGYRDFWSLRLKVSAATLIPRPETELLVEIALNLPITKDAKVLDLGTGTGAIALALASECLYWSVTGIDKSSAAVSLAKENGVQHQLERVNFIQSDWFSGVEQCAFDLIVTNPPYIEDNNHYLQQGDVRFEPSSALTSGADGLDDIRLIIAQSKKYLANKGYLVIEHGYQQSAQVADIFRDNGFEDIRIEYDLNDLPRVTLGSILPK